MFFIPAVGGRELCVVKEKVCICSSTSALSTNESMQGVGLEDFFLSKPHCA